MSDEESDPTVIFASEEDDQTVISASEEDDPTVISALEEDDSTDLVLVKVGQKETWQTIFTAWVWT